MSTVKWLRPLTVFAVVIFVLVAYLLLPASPMRGASSAAPSSQVATETAGQAAAEARGGPDEPFTILEIPEAAPGYCSSSGGSSAYENISSVSLVPQAGGTQQLSVQVYIANPKGCTAGEPCESYDPSPENVNVWIDWNGNSAWEANEQVMDKALTGYLGINYGGTMSAIGQVVVPANAVGVTWMRANLGWGSDPNDPCTQSWQWGNVVDKQVALSPPKIKEIKVTGSPDPKNPMATFEVKLEAVLEPLPPGYEVVKVTWAGDAKPGEGNPYTYIPDKGTHGQKTIKAILTYKHTPTSVEGTVEKEHTFKLFFKKAGDDDGDNLPNWFEYWNSDGAIPSLNSADIKYDATTTGYGAWNPSTDKIDLGSAAANIHYPTSLVVPAIANKCPGGTFGGALGIDSVAEVIAHERQHETTTENWKAGGSWTVGTTLDSDDPTPTDKNDIRGDQLPDDHEKNTTKTSYEMLDSCNLATLKSAVYADYGDDEFVAIKAGHNKTGVADKDWALPGKQSDPPYAGTAMAAGMLAETSVSGAAGPNTPYAATTSPAGVVIPGLAQLTGSYTDAGVDNNSDALFDVLRINVGLNVAAAGEYHLVGWLRDSENVEFAFASYTANLPVGSQQIPLDFDGKLVQQHGKNGPFTLARIELRIDDHDDLLQFEENVHTTAAYPATAFALPNVTLTGTFGDSGADTNANALFDLLNVTTAVQVNTPGNYTLIGWLYDKDGVQIPNGSATVAFSASGAVTLAFDGRAIRWQRAQGPYSVRELEVRDANGERVLFVSNAYTTAAYLPNQFEGSATAIVAASYSDQGLDVNADSKYDYLNVVLHIDVAQTGNYQLLASLRVSEREPIFDISLPISLTAGSNQTVTVQFPGGPIRGHGVNGPYLVGGVTLIDSQGSIIDYQKVAHITQAYQAEDFAQPLVALANSIQDSPSDPNGDGSNDWLNIVVSVQPGNSGYVVAQGRLVDKNGKEIGWTEQNAPVEAGVVAQVTLAFSATQIAANGVDGPFTLRNLLVYHTGDPGQAVEVEEAHTTAAYDHLTLQAPLSKLFVPVVSSAITTVSPTCTPDAARETTNVGDAQTICPQQTVAGTVNVEGDRDDVFRIALPANQHIRITMTGTGGDADLYLYPPSTTNVTGGGYYVRSVLVSNNELIDTTTNAAGNWYVDVYAYQEGTSYSLKVELLGSPTAAEVDWSATGIDKNK